MRVSLPHQNLGKTSQKEKSSRSRREANVAEVKEVSEGKRQIVCGPMAREGIWILCFRASSQYFLLLAK